MRATYSARHGLVLLLVFALAVFCWETGRGALRELQAMEPVTTYRGLEGLLAADYDALKLRETRAVVPRPFALWSQRDGVVVAARGSGHSAEASLLAVRGEPGLVLADARALSESDYSGCLLDRKTAEQLFGTADAVGAAVVIERAEYTVRGVLQGPARIVMTAVDSGHKTGLENLSVMGEEQGDTFVERHNLRAAYTTGSGLYVLLARFLCATPLFAAHLVAMGFLREWQRRWREYPVRHTIVTLAMFAAATSLCLSLLRQAPPDFIPSRWADFAFWSTAVPQWMTQAGEHLAAAKLKPDLVLISLLLRSALCLLSAHLLLCMYHLHRIFRKDTAIAWMVGELGAVRRAVGPSTQVQDVSYNRRDGIAEDCGG